MEPRDHGLEHQADVRVANRLRPQARHCPRKIIKSGNQSDRLLAASKNQATKIGVLCQDDDLGDHADQMVVSAQNFH